MAEDSERYSIWYLHPETGRQIQLAQSRIAKNSEAKQQVITCRLLEALAVHLQHSVSIELMELPEHLSADRILQFGGLVEWLYYNTEEYL